MWVVIEVLVESSNYFSGGIPDSRTTSSSHSDSEINQRAIWTEKTIQLYFEEGHSIIDYHALIKLIKTESESESESNLNQNLNQF